MRVLNSKEFVTLQIDECDTKKFEAFLDRNFPGWRSREPTSNSDELPICRSWMVGVDDIERSVFFRKQYVEVFDEFVDGADDFMVHYPKHLICDIDGDLTAVAVWKEPPRRH